MPRKRATEVPREYTGSPLLDRIQQALRDLARSLKTCIFLDGKPKRIRFESGVVRTISHRLGVRASFFVINGNGRIQVSPVEQLLLDERYQLALVSLDDGDFDLWFYPYIALPTE